MRLFQIGLTKREQLPVYMVAGVTAVYVEDKLVIDSDGNKWTTQWGGYMKNYKVGDNIIITHVHTKEVPTLHSWQSSDITNTIEI